MSATFIPGPTQNTVRTADGTVLSAPVGWMLMPPGDPFEKKVRAAAVAGWWVVLIAVGFLALLWLIYLAVMAVHPAWLLTMWGPGVDWPFVQQVWFWVMAAFKFCIWLMILAVLWLTLWARQLRRADRP